LSLSRTVNFAYGEGKLQVFTHFTAGQICLNRFVAIMARHNLSVPVLGAVNIRGMKRGEAQKQSVAMVLASAMS
jgi:hypothetical protein